MITYLGSYPASCQFLFKQQLHCYPQSTVSKHDIYTFLSFFSSEQLAIDQRVRTLFVDRVCFALNRVVNKDPGRERGIESWTRNRVENNEHSVTTDKMRTQWNKKYEIRIRLKSTTHSFRRRPRANNNRKTITLPNPKIYYGMHHANYPFRFEHVPTLWHSLSKTLQKRTQDTRETIASHSLLATYFRFTNSLYGDPSEFRMTMFVMVVRTLLCQMIAKSYVSFPSFGSVRLLWDTSSVRRVTAWLEDTERHREQVTHYVETPILVVQHRFLRSHTQRGLADNPRWRVWRSNRQKKNQLRDRVQPLDKRERCEARDEGVARVRCSWRENGGEGSPGSAALSLYARNNILMKERPDSEVPTSGRAAELLASPPLRGRPLPPLHNTGDGRMCSVSRLSPPFVSLTH